MMRSRLVGLTLLGTVGLLACGEAADSPASGPATSTGAATFVLPATAPDRFAFGTPASDERIERTRSSPTCST
jgi:hypothetical protein